MRVVILVPRRAGNRTRDLAWDWCRRRWETHFPEFPIYEGHHDDGPFNRSAGINTASDMADVDARWDYAIIIDADIFLARKQVVAAYNLARKTGHVTWAHRRWRGFHEDATEQLIKGRHDFGADLDRGDDMDLLVERTTPLSWSCCIVVPRAVWDDMGGYDERFKGWGFEDMAFMSVVCGLYGHERVEGDVYHLWHPRSPERIVKGEPAATAAPEYVMNARLGRRYMVALRRDAGLHDRPGLPSTPEERDRDIANLKRDDARLAPVASRLGLPRWDQWWPGLEELRDGAKAYRFGERRPGITVVVRSGGSVDNWPVRRDYLRRSLASLEANVTGSIVQRVIYSDWEDSVRPELDAIAARFGYYVAGDGHHSYTASARRLWSYLSSRAKGDYIFLAEDDFVYLRPVDLAPMIDVLRAAPHVAQVALLRKPYYPRELGSDGILGWPKASFKREGSNGSARLEHRNFWTMNPSLFRKSITSTPWPARDSSERVFGDLILRSPKARFAFWGEGEAWIDHIGAERAGSGY